MVLKSKYRSNSYDQDDYPQTSSENGPDSPFSGDELASVVVPAPKKSRRNIKKRVVHVPIGDLSRSKSDAYPPSDSWAWRKYGQKPIKGSPYPRGYYRCSSSKGCPARKQVERSRVDPKMLVITYASEHNHPLPTFKHHHKTVAAAATRSNGNLTFPVSPPLVTPLTPVSANECTDEDVSEQLVTPEQINPFEEPPHLEFVGDTLMLGNLGIEYSWIPDFTFNAPIFVGPKFDDIEVEMLTMQEEDELLFGELDELPECSTVFRRGHESNEICAHVTPVCTST